MSKSELPDSGVLHFNRLETYGTLKIGDFSGSGEFNFIDYAVGLPDYDFR